VAVLPLGAIHPLGPKSSHHHLAHCECAAHCTLHLQGQGCPVASPVMSRWVFCSPASWKLAPHWLCSVRERCPSSDVHCTARQRSQGATTPSAPTRQSSNRSRGVPRVGHSIFCVGPATLGPKGTRLRTQPLRQAGSHWLARGAWYTSPSVSQRRSSRGRCTAPISPSPSPWLLRPNSSSTARPILF
jgi:hypothetical protein